MDQQRMCEPQSSAFGIGDGVVAAEAFDQQDRPVVIGDEAELLRDLVVAARRDVQRRVLCLQGAGEPGGGEFPAEEAAVAEVCQAFREAIEPP